MDSAKRSRVEAWFQYASDLGLGPYFRDRTSSSAPVEPAPPAAMTLSAQAGVTETRSATPSAAPTRGASLPIISVAPGPTLFEAAEQFVGETLEDIRADIGACTRCRLHKGRTKLVFGVGNPKAELVFVGEGPGHDEDVQGEPFVGRAGKVARRSDGRRASRVCRPAIVGRRDDPV